MEFPTSWRSACDAHYEWLVSQDSASAKQWLDHMRSPDEAQREGAVAEALAREYFVPRSSGVELVDRRGSGGADFRFFSDESSFLVEVTNISTIRATSSTGLEPSVGKNSAQFYSLLTQQIRDELQSKAGRLAKVSLSEPVLVAVTLLHFQASAICVGKNHIEELLLGKRHIGWTFDPRIGQAVGDPENVTTLHPSLFFRLKPDLLRPGRQFAELTCKHISGVVVMGLGVAPPSPPVLGVLHPEALYPFKTEWLADVPFGRLSPWPPTDRSINVVWSDVHQVPASTPAMPKLIIPSDADYGDFDSSTLKQQ